MEGGAAMRCVFCGCEWHPETGRTFGWPQVFHACRACFSKEVVPTFVGSLTRKERLCTRRNRTESDPKVYFSDYAAVSLTPAEEE
jgi:hypothetical protein